ncbi:MAG: hypothetical protein IT359_08825 [Gemmatimonadaceae bacterium]|nr:hypothetical protein [Gemmatimonadaceae bacterium]
MSTPRGSRDVVRRDARMRPAMRAAIDVLAVLRDESPQVYARVAELLAQAPAQLAIGDETLGVSAGHGIVALRDVAPDGWLMQVVLDYQSVVALVDGTVTLEQLLTFGLLDVRGHPDALLAFLAASRAVGAAGTRSSALQRIFERFRGEVG